MQKKTHTKQNFLINFLSLGNAAFGFLGICHLKYVVKGTDDAQKIGFALSSYRHLSGRDGKLCNLCYFPGCLGQVCLLLAVHLHLWLAGSSPSMKPTAPCQWAGSVLSLVLPLSVKEVGFGFRPMVFAAAATLADLETSREAECNSRDLYIYVTMGTQKMHNTSVYKV